MVTYINCESCGKRIELKFWRTLCIPCRNKRDKELRRIKRDNPEEYRRIIEENKLKYNRNPSSHCQ